jgi:ribose/xylose/arabinose/galactoside ABC-type transport system permease subunit
MLAAISIGASVGTINAVLTEVWGWSVVVTLGTMIAVRGLALLALGAYPG